MNCQLVAAVLRNPDHLLAGTAATELIAGLGPEPEDLVSTRLHGVSPFTGTSLDTWLRNLGVRTVVATGVSVNLGVLGLAIEAVNLGYRVVVPRDTVAGIPAGLRRRRPGQHVPAHLDGDHGRRPHRSVDGPVVMTGRRRN